MTLQSNADIELDHQLVWQMSPNGIDWIKIGYGNALAFTVSEEDAQAYVRFRMADGTFSDACQLNALIPGETDEAEVTDETEGAEATDGTENAEATDEAEQLPVAEPVRLPDNRKVSIDLAWEDEEDPGFGSVALLTATLEGYDELDYTLQWVYSEDQENWTMLEGANEAELRVTASEENYLYYWRVEVHVDGFKSNV